MKVFALDANSPGFEELCLAVDHARKIGTGLRVGVDGNALKLAIGQMMWSLPIAELPEPARESSASASQAEVISVPFGEPGRVQLGNHWLSAERMDDGTVIAHNGEDWYDASPTLAATFQSNASMTKR
jgi:hypothetical protein